MFDLEKLELWWLIGFAVFFMLGWLALGLTVAAVYNARSRVLARLKEVVRSAQEP